MRTVCFYTLQKDIKGPLVVGSVAICKHLQGCKMSDRTDRIPDRFQNLRLAGALEYLCLNEWFMLSMFIHNHTPRRTESRNLE